MHLSIVEGTVETLELPTHDSANKSKIWLDITTASLAGRTAGCNSSCCCHRHGAGVKCREHWGISNSQVGSGAAVTSAQLHSSIASLLILTKTAAHCQQGNISIRPECKTFRCWTYFVRRVVPTQQFKSSAKIEAICLLSDGPSELGGHCQCGDDDDDPQEVVG